MPSFFVNGKLVQVNVDPATPLLWVLRDSLEMMGTKFGCGMALCGACTVHLDGKAIRSCVAPLSRAEGKHVTTIEGLSANLTHPLQRAWIELDGFVRLRPEPPARMGCPPRRSRVRNRAQCQ